MNQILRLLVIHGLISIFAGVDMGTVLVILVVIVYSHLIIIDVLLVCTFDFSIVFIIVTFLIRLLRAPLVLLLLINGDIISIFIYVLLLSIMLLVGYDAFT